METNRSLFDAPETRGRRTIFWIALFYLLFAVYYPSLKGPFVYDDVPSIPENPDLQAPDGWKRVFDSHENSLQFDHRPVGGLVSWATVQLFGLDVRAFHIGNLLIHWLAAVILGETILLIGRQLGFGRKVSWFALASAALWAVHPLNSQAVIYIYQRMETLMVLFAFLAFACRVQALRSPEATRWRWHCACGACVMLSALSKEIGVGMPALLALLDRSVFYDRWKAWMKGTWPFYLILTLCLAPVLTWVLTGSRVAEVMSGDVLTQPVEYFKIQCRVVFNYLKLSIWPSPLIFQYAPQHVESWREWVPHFMFLLGVTAGMLALVKRASWFWLPAFGGFVWLAPTSSFLPIPLEPVAEYRMYLPLAGWIVLGVYFLGLFLKKLRLPPPALAIVLVALIGFSSFVSHRRSYDYRSHIALWGDVVEKQPYNFRAWAILGNIHLHQSEWESVSQVGQQMLQLGESLQSPFGMMTGCALLGEAALAQDRFQEAEAWARQSLGLGDSPVAARRTLALALSRSGNPQEAIAVLKASTEGGPVDDRMVGARIEIEAAAGNLPFAREMLERAMIDFPKSEFVKEAAEHLAQLDQPVP